MSDADSGPPASDPRGGGRTWAWIRFCPRCGADRLESRVPRQDDRERQVCADCGYVHYVGPALAAGVILRDADGGRICLVRRAFDPGRGRWTFPGGFVDLGETPREAALRELAEESGYRAEPGPLVGVWHSRGPRGKSVVILVYAARLLDGKMSRCEEVEEVRWFSEADLPWERLAFESTRLALRAYLERAGQDSRDG